MADQDDEIIDQNDIDKLLEASSIDMEDSADDIGELSQDDIDALMDGGGQGIVSTPASVKEDEGEEDELDLISQDDINRLVNKKKEQPVDTPETIETVFEEEPVLQEEPGVLEEADVQEEPEIQVEPEEVEEPVVQEESFALEDGVIDESESVSVEECLVTQEAIDLLSNEDQEDLVSEDSLELEEQVLKQETTSTEQSLLPEEYELEEDITLEIEQEEVVEEEITTEQEVVAMEEEKEEDIMEDSEPDAMVVDLGEDDDLTEELDGIGDEELQEDIDSLLDDPTDSDDEDEDWEQDSLISQADIEDLIKSSENEDEDALGDLDSPDDEDSFGAQDDEEEYEEYEEEDSTVVLEEPEDRPNEKSKGKSKKKKKEKKKRKPIKIGKKVLVIAASVMFLVVTLSLTGFFLMKKNKKSIPEQRKMVAEVMPIQEPVVESVEVIVNNSAKPKVSRPIPASTILEPLVMNNFVILAPETIEGLAYIEADINIDYSTDNAYYEIKENMPFFRDVIYLAIQKALSSTKGDKITESDLLVIVKKALQKAMPEGSIKNVDFNSFKAG